MKGKSKTSIVAAKPVVSMEVSKFSKEVLNDPIKALIETSIGVFDTNGIDFAKGLGRVVLAARSGKLLDQFVQELRNLKKQGSLKTDEEISCDDYAQKTFADLLLLIDSNPEAEKLKAVKLLFFKLISKDSHDVSQNVLHILVNSIMTLSAAELITLKSIYDSRLNIKLSVDRTTGVLTKKRWYELVAQQEGHNIPEIIENNVSGLSRCNLLDKSLPERSEDAPIPVNFFLPTKLGNELYKYLSE